MTVKVDFKGTNAAGTARAMDAAPQLIRLNVNGRPRLATPDDLVKGVAMALRPVMQAKAYDAGLKAGASIAANRAIACALLASNRSGQVARAIDSMFDTMPNSRSLTVAQAIDSIDGEPMPNSLRNMPAAKALDHIIEGTDPAQQDSAANVIASI